MKKSLYASVLMLLFIFLISPSCKKKSLDEKDTTKYDGIYQGYSVHYHQYFDTTVFHYKTDTTITPIPYYDFNLANEKNNVSDGSTILENVIDNDSIKLRCTSCPLRTQISCVLYTKKDSVVFYSEFYGIGQMSENNFDYKYLKKK